MHASLARCGIAGWLDFDRDLRAHGPTVRAMTAVLALRGPGGEGVWLDEHIALGHRRLPVLDPAGGAQPMLAKDGERVLAALAYGGETYNHRDLALPAQTRSDTEAVLRAYLRWGEDFAQRLEGMYAIALWDARRECLLLVRDRLGVKPLYYLPAGSGALFASEPKAIAAHPLGRLSVDLDGLRELLASVRTPGHAVYRGLREVRPGEIVRIDRTGVHARRYWRPAPAEHRDDWPATVHTVRSLLSRAVTGQLHADVPLCALLSGGLDSSAVAALAVAARPDLRTVSLDDPDDAPHARAAAAFLRTRHEQVTVDAAQLADVVHRAAALTALELPTGLGEFHVSLYLLFRSVAERATVALTGEGADELFGGYPWCHDPRAAGTFPWLAGPYAARADPSGPSTDVLSPELSAALELPEYRDDAYASALSEVDHVPSEGPAQRRMRASRYLHLTRLLPILLDRMDRMSMACGIEARVPFCDHRLVEYAYNVPWSMHTYDGREKSLLRAAVSEDLPADVLRRRKRPYPVASDPAYELALRSQLLHVLEDSTSPVRPLLDTAKAWHLIVAPIAQPGLDAGRRAVELLLSLDRWLRTVPLVSLPF
ncbi:asparagine synthase (glutamine-hydrolyzing) [Dactylosporangium sp. CA-139066]|uniref:asparagine synthase (glutamine-hydrolyzing) n=1 Tax=Dactylosporangium sp. CA-139066 TaxID=3239930 RepID=UPI003D947D81